MKITSRVVYRGNEYRGSTGTIIEYSNSIITVALDNGAVIECSHKDIIAIDDITDIGNIDFKVGMNVYDVQFDMVGKVIDVEDAEELYIHSIDFGEGRILSYPLVEEFNFVVID